GGKKCTLALPKAAAANRIAAAEKRKRAQESDTDAAPAKKKRAPAIRNADLLKRIEKMDEIINELNERITNLEDECDNNFAALARAQFEDRTRIQDVAFGTVVLSRDATYAAQQAKAALRGIEVMYPSRFKTPFGRLMDAAPIKISIDGTPKVFGKPYRSVMRRVEVSPDGLSGASASAGSVRPPIVGDIVSQSVTAMAASSARVSDPTSAGMDPEKERTVPPADFVNIRPAVSAPMPQPPILTQNASTEPPANEPVDSHPISTAARNNNADEDAVDYEDDDVPTVQGPSTDIADGGDVEMGDPTDGFAADHSEAAEEVPSAADGEDHHGASDMQVDPNIEDTIDREFNMEEPLTPEPTSDGEDGNEHPAPPVPTIEVQPPSAPPPKKTRSNSNAVASSSNLQPPARGRKPKHGGRGKK
ncbi:hypothetical protein CVT24_002519, partial [Panaeolus cyanescens]